MELSTICLYMERYEYTYNLCYTLQSTYINCGQISLPNPIHHQVYLRISTIILYILIEQAFSCHYPFKGTVSLKTLNFIKRGVALCFTLFRSSMTRTLYKSHVLTIANTLRHSHAVLECDTQYTLRHFNNPSHPKRHRFGPRHANKQHK